MLTYHLHQAQEIDNNNKKRKKWRSVPHLTVTVAPRRKPIAVLSCKHRAPAAWEAGTRSVGLPAPIRSSALAAGARAVGWQLPAPHSSWQCSPAGTWGAPSRTNFAFFVFANFFSSSLSVLIALLCWGHLGLPLCQILLFQLVVYLAWSNLYAWL